MRDFLPPHIEPNHPVVLQEYAVYTPPIDDMIIKIGDWIDQKKTGGYIYGPSRFGKSRGIKWYVRAALEERFKSKIPLVIWSRVPGIQSSEAEFWWMLLIASKFQFADPQKIMKKSRGRFLFMQRLITLARSAKSNYVVLLIDEAQDITLREWQWLLGLQNELDYEGYRLTVFSIGAHQMGYQHEYLARTGNAHIAARFLVSHTRFRGITSADEIAYIAHGYDLASDWPKGTSTSFLKHFAPLSFEQGKRISHCADDIWKSVNALLLNVVGRKAVEVPMQHVAQSIETALFRLAKGEDWNTVTCYESWLEMISQTGISDHVRMIYAVT